jgi:hypothetical protein
MSRKSYKPRPRPDNPSAIVLDKKTVGIAQLETALSLWFQNGDLISILVLAYNAHDCLHALAKRAGKPSFFGDWLETMPQSFQKRIRYVADFCKHGAMDIAEPTPHVPKVAEVFAYFAGRCYRALYGKPTLLMFAFEIRHAAEHPDLLLPKAIEANAELAKIYDPALVSREEFLNDARKYLVAPLRNYPT